MSNQAIPAHLETDGTALYRAATDEYELSLTEQAALLQACETLDTLSTLETALREQGRILRDGKPNPLMVELRQQRAILVRLLGLLDLRIGDDGQPTDANSSMSPTSRAALKAARKRWS